MGLDTSVVLRLLIGFPEAQAEKARSFLNSLFQEKRRAVLSDLVAAESYFALIHHYQVPETQALKALREMLESGFVFPEPGGAALETLKNRHAAKAGFMDQLIHNQYLGYAEAVATLDADFGKMEKVHRLDTKGLPSR